MYKLQCSFLSIRREVVIGRFLFFVLVQPDLFAVQNWLGNDVSRGHSAQARVDRYGCHRLEHRCMLGNLWMVINRVWACGVHMFQFVLRLISCRWKTAFRIASCSSFFRKRPSRIEDTSNLYHFLGVDEERGCVAIRAYIYVLVLLHDAPPPTSHEPCDEG